MNIVAQIHESLTTIAQGILGASWKPMKKVISPEENDMRLIENSFGWRFGDASSVDGITKVYTLDHTFELVLGRRVVDRSDDVQVLTVMKDLYDKADEIFRQVVLKKAGLPSIVLLISEPNIRKPEVLKNEGAVLILSLVVKYRNAIT
jgi:hypothetical protein